MYSVGTETGKRKSTEAPEMECPCGAGLCIVLTANTAKNPGRQFYKCPASSEVRMWRHIELAENLSICSCILEESNL